MAAVMVGHSRRPFYLSRDRKVLDTLGAVALIGKYRLGEIPPGLFVYRRRKRCLALLVLHVFQTSEPSAGDAKCFALVSFRFIYSQVLREAIQFALESTFWNPIE